MKVNAVWAMDKILTPDKDELRKLFNEMNEDDFEMWYLGTLALYETCQDHINKNGLEHLRDNYER